VGRLEPVKRYIGTLVHPSAQRDPVLAARHRTFIAPRLFGGLVAFAAFPAYIAIEGVPEVLGVTAFAAAIVPILAAYVLSRTGRYEGAHLLSCASIAGFVTLLSAQTGGIHSFAAVWLVLVPVDAALSCSRRVMAVAVAVALAAIGCLAGLSHAALLPAPAQSGHVALAALGILAAMLYATGLALSVESFVRNKLALLRAGREQYRLLAQEMSEVVTRHNHKGGVLFASPSAERLLGVAPATLLGHGLFDRIHVDDRPAYLSALAEAAAGGTRQSVELRVRREPADGQPVDFVWIEMQCRPRDADETTANNSHAREVVAVMRDIGERKAREQELAEAREAIAQADESKRRFLATMSHELRTPLNVVIGFSEMLVGEGRLQLDAERRREYVRLINDSGHHLLSLVNGLLDMSKIEAGTFEITTEPFAPGPVIVNCCDLLALQAREAGLTIAVDPAPDLPEIVADARAFRQILLNLVTNAIKFTNRGGRIRVGARAYGSTLSISVEDNGIGIGEDDLPRLGDPFFQARSSYGRRHDGSGLGLSIVKGLVRLHGGEVDISSRIGKGTCVMVNLPLDCERARSADPARLPAPSGEAAVAPARTLEFETPVRKRA
jgi:cell cycle sensor histidine kinase DivJ